MAKGSIEGGDREGCVYVKENIILAFIIFWVEYYPMSLYKLIEVHVSK